MQNFEVVSTATLCERLFYVYSVNMETTQNTVGNWLGLGTKSFKVILNWSLKGRKRWLGIEKNPKFCTNHANQVWKQKALIILCWWTSQVLCILCLPWFCWFSGNRNHKQFFKHWGMKPWMIPGTALRLHKPMLFIGLPFSGSHKFSIAK